MRSQGNCLGRKWPEKERSWGHAEESYSRQAAGLQLTIWFCHSVCGVEGTEGRFGVLGTMCVSCVYFKKNHKHLFFHHTYVFGTVFYGFLVSLILHPETLLWYSRLYSVLYYSLVLCIYFFSEFADLLWHVLSCACNTPFYLYTNYVINIHTA